MSPALCSAHLHLIVTTKASPHRGQVMLRKCPRTYASSQWFSAASRLAHSVIYICSKCTFPQALDSWLSNSSTPKLNSKGWRKTIMHERVSKTNKIQQTMNQQTISGLQIFASLKREDCTLIREWMPTLEATLHAAEKYAPFLSISTNTLIGSDWPKIRASKSM